MHALADALARLDREGPVGRAVVLATWGSAPCPPGSMLLSGAQGGIAGSVSGGCVESAVLEEIAAIRGTPVVKRVRYQVTDETAWGVGLACGGALEVLVEGTIPPEVRRAMTDEEGSTVVTAIDGSQRALTPDTASGAVAGLITLDGAELFVEPFSRPTELCVIGAGHVAQQLVPLAKRLGFRTLLFDARAAFLTKDRFPEADELISGWPAEELPKRIGASSYVCVLSHDPKLDEPCVRLALRSPARYVGVIGSKKNQEKRRVALATEGYEPEEIARLHGPIGLPIGGNRPDEIALSILAELVAVRAGRKV